MKYPINDRRLAMLALSSVLTCLRAGYPLSEDTKNEIRLAHSVLTDGPPSAIELVPFLGDKWQIGGPDGLTTKKYQEAQIAALAARLDLSHGFVAARVHSCGRHDFKTLVKRDPLTLEAGFGPALRL